MNPTGKDRVEAMRAGAGRRRATEFIAGIERRAQGVRYLFANSRCDVCSGAIVRREGDRGLVCANGHPADLDAAKRRREAQTNARAKAATHEMDLIEAWRLQAKRGRQP